MTSEVDWRRRWKPDLISQAWNVLSIEDTPWLMKYIFIDSGYQILFSDKVYLWHEDMSSEDVSRRTKKLNPSVEAPTNKILDHLQDNLENVGTRKDVTISASYKSLADSDGKKIIVTLSTKLAGLPFVWKFSGMPTENEMISSHLLVPLLTMTGELMRRQQELYKLLQNKDKEIDDLKAQGVKVTRKHLETGTFDDIVFKNNMVVSKGFQQQVQAAGSMAFVEDGQILYRDLMTKQAYLNRTPSEGDEDGGTFDDDGMMSASGDVAGSSWSNRLPPSLANAGTISPRGSPSKSPNKAGVNSGDDGSPSKISEKQMELKRRQELEDKLAADCERKETKKKKKKLRL